jgi:hypothetical protein
MADFNPLSTTWVFASAMRNTYRQRLSTLLVDNPVKMRTRYPATSLARCSVLLSATTSRYPVLLCTSGCV